MSPSETTPPLSRKERDKLVREQDFLDAAERLISEQGYFETSMEDVAREAEYATGTIYRYFASKEELYHKLLLRKGEAYFHQVMQLLDQPATPREKIENITREKINFFFDNQAFMRIYLNELASSSASGRRCGPPKELKTHFLAYQQVLLKILKKGIRLGEFQKIDPELTLHAWLGATNEILSTNLDQEKPRSREEIAEYLTTFFRHGLFRK